VNIIEHKATDRGQADFGWFKAKYSFSFGQWHDPNKMGFGALRVFNDSIIQPNKGFPEHPHNNMEVITVQLQGKLNHTDVSGTRVIQAGDVQVITAGSGVTHSDLNIGSDEAKQFQIWIYPNKKNAIPQSNIEHFEESGRQNKWQVLASPFGDSSSRLNLLQDAWLSRGVFDANDNVRYTTHKPANGIYLFVVEGKVDLANNSVSRRDALGISEANEIQFSCTEKSDILIIEVPMD
jgi:quercetin 2,3-dioxygenase